MVKLKWTILRTKFKDVLCSKTRINYDINVADVEKAVKPLKGVVNNNDQGGSVLK